MADPKTDPPQPDPPQPDPAPDPPAPDPPAPDPPAPDPKPDPPKPAPQSRTIKLDENQLEEFGKTLIAGVTGGVVERIKPDQPPVSGNDPTQPPPPPNQPQNNPPTQTQEGVHWWEKKRFTRKG